MEAALLTAEEVRQRQDGVFKYVCVAGRFRFMECEVMGPRHSDMVKPGEVASCAGAISWDGKEATMLDSYSSSLKVGTDEEGWKALEDALGSKVKARWE